jgi:Family of unknown function (DUF6624)
VPDTALRAELLRRVATDQAVREQFLSAFRAGNRPDSALLARLNGVDAENTRWLAETVARRGWPGARSPDWMAVLVAGRAVPKPIRDSADVDARRATVGLPPLREYLRMLDSVNASHAPH